MKASDINNGLYWLLSRQAYQIQIPSFTPIRWWESDHYAVTKAGYAVEFEIKTSVADFKADAKKQKDGRAMRDGQGYVRDDKGGFIYSSDNKHEQLAAKCIHGPSRFYFVCPEGVLQVRDMPEWAGLIWAFEKKFWRYPICHEQKPAPKLHRQKVDQSVLETIRNAMYYRYWTLRTRMKAIPDIAEHCPPIEGTLSEEKEELFLLPQPCTPH